MKSTRPLGCMARFASTGPSDLGPALSTSNLESDQAHELNSIAFGNDTIPQ